MGASTKTMETFGSTAAKALGFAVFCFGVRQVVLATTVSHKHQLRDLTVWTTQSTVGRNETLGVAKSVKLPDWMSDWELEHDGRRAHDFAKLDDQAFQRYLLEQEAEWKNELAFCLLPQAFKEKIKLDTWPLIARSWLRSFMLANLIYLGLGLTWAYYIYNVYGFRFFPTGATPRVGDVAEQIKVSLGALPMYSFLPALCENIVERGWTLAYVRVDEYGWANYLFYFFAYMAFVEFGVYWNHRLLHDLRFGYDKLHYIHHKYNKENTLSPFAGLAFHPIDGILQAIPYFWTLFVFPMHALTYELMLFSTAVWTTNIHDCVEVECQPIMGAGYHTIHHTTYRHNYGQFFTYMDRAFGTILYPDNSGKKHWNK